MTTATATKAKPSKAPAVPMTFAEIAAQKMRDTIEQYREQVARAAGGEAIDPVSAEKVLAMLAFMHLPDYAWDRDVAAHRDYAATTAAIEQATADAPARELRLVEVVARIKAIEEELKALQSERHTLASVDPMVRVGHMSRRNELTVNHPHLFLEVEQAAQMRSDAKAKATGVKR